MKAHPLPKVHSAILIPSPGREGVEESHENMAKVVLAQAFVRLGARPTG